MAFFVTACGSKAMGAFLNHTDPHQTNTAYLQPVTEAYQTDHQQGSYANLIAIKVM